MKKAQLSIIMLTGVSLLIGFFLLVILEKKPEFESPQLVDEPALDSYVTTCLETTLEEGLAIIAAQGGYYDPPEPFAEFSTGRVPFYVHNYQVRYPSIDNIEKEISNYVENHIGECLASFEPFREQGYEVVVEEINVQTTLSVEEVNVKLRMPTSLKKADTMQVISDFSATKNIKFYQAYTAIEELMNELQKNPNVIPFSDLISLSQEHNFEFNLIYLTDENILYNLIFEDLFQGNELIYNFVVGYNWEKTEEVYSQEEHITPQKAFVGEQFLLTANFGEDVVYKDYTALFDVDPKSGRISFVPKKEDIGTHYIVLEGTEFSGKKKVDVFELTIEE